jgi:hypothetical protein
MLKNALEDRISREGREGHEDFLWIDPVREGFQNFSRGMHPYRYSMIVVPSFSCFPFAPLCVASRLNHDSSLNPLIR